MSRQLRRVPISRLSVRPASLASTAVAVAWRRRSQTLRDHGTDADDHEDEDDVTDDDADDDEDVYDDDDFRR